MSLLLLFSGGGSPAPATPAFGGASNGTTTVTLTGVTAGATIAVLVKSSSAATTSITATSSLGGTFNKRGQLANDGTNAYSLQLLVMTGAAAGTHVITPTVTGGGAAAVTIGYWATGVDDIDASLSAVATSGNFPIAGGTGNGNVLGPIAPWTNGCLVVGMFTDIGGTPSFTAGTSPNSFTSRLNPGGANGVFVEDFTQSTAGLIAATAGNTAAHVTAGAVFALTPSGTALPTSGVRQVAHWDELDGNAAFQAYTTVALPYATLPGSTIVIIGAVANFAGTVAQSAQQSGLGSPGVTGDPTNGAYTQRLNFNTPAPGTKNWSLWTKENAASVSAGTLFCVNYTAADDYRGITVIEVAGTAASSYINSASANLSAVAAGTDNLTATAALGSSPAYVIGWCRGNNTHAFYPAVGTGAKAILSSDQFDNEVPSGVVEQRTLASPGTTGALFSSRGSDDYTVLMVGLLQANANVSVNLAGQTITSSAGTITPANALAATAQTVNTTEGTITASQGVTVALAAQSITSSAGTVTPATAAATTAQTVTASGGSVRADHSATAAAQSITASGGTVSAATSVAAAGQTVTASGGTVSPGQSVATAGQTTTASLGTISPARSVATTAQTVTSSEGTITASVGGNVSVSLAAQTITSSGGTVVPATAVNASAQTVTSSEGTVGVQIGGNVTVNLTGQTVTLSVGSVFAASAIQVTAQTATSSQGTVSAATAASLAGQTITSSEGTISASGSVNVSLAGQTATASLGSVAVARSASVAGQTSTSSLGAVVAASAIQVAGQSVTTTEGAIGKQVSGPVTVALAGQTVTMTQGVINAAGYIAYINPAKTVGVQGPGTVIVRGPDSSTVRGPDGVQVHGPDGVIVRGPDDSKVTA